MRFLDWAQRLLDWAQRVLLRRSDSHIIDGEFQSDKYPRTPRGLIPLKPEDPMARDLLAEYARRRRVLDSQFSDDVLEVIRLAEIKKPLARIVVTCDHCNTTHGCQKPLGLIVVTCDHCGTTHGCHL